MKNRSLRLSLGAAGLAAAVLTIGAAGAQPVLAGPVAGAAPAPPVARAGAAQATAAGTALLINGDQVVVPAAAPARLWSGSSRQLARARPSR